MTERDLIRRLENSPVPSPPEDLAARIINDIPAEIELHPELEHEEHRRRFQRRPVWMAAAAAVTIALTGAVTWELRHERPVVETQLAAKGERNVFGSDDNEEKDNAGSRVELSEGLSDAPVVENKVDHDREVLEAEPVTAEEVPAAIIVSTDQEGEMRTRARPFPVPDPSPAEPNLEVDRGQVGLRSRTVVEESENGINIVPEPVQIADEIRVTAESPAIDTTQLRVGAGTGKRQAPPMPVGGGRELRYEMKGVPGTEDSKIPAYRNAAQPKKSKGLGEVAQPSTGGMAEPNDKPYGDVFFEHTGVNPFVDTEEDRLSTFGLDVDTGSFTIARRYLREGHLPPQAAIRVEEWVNAFDYGDASPRKEDFRLVMEGAPSVFASSERIYTLRLAVKAREVDAADRPAAVLVFCVDVSGSMDRGNRLGLVKQALHELLANLRSDDHVGLVVYGSSGRVLLKPTTDHDRILVGINNLRAGGSTNAEEGLVLAYDLLSDGDDDGRLRRVILCSDGVA
ncbi:MAG: von Willebrand factor type A domain-containing protein, partial [Acidobacteriota bacterium]